ncbi:MerR family transcriptional regulator [Muriicola sp. Z0-33]|uniref:MerR family transcriptional regulator n=1 Tax=Muriicola sp. Z0-33 TaxID=2816957 RepID=UPI002236F0D6|nr:MerR family transcriptional regulator [Muriicola sp. Z0-33]MCW5517343.1 MerR family transcriptional regulator [Muriicola sp. Z0-33]
MNNIKKSFSIRDLENLSGIKAHTIRIWEKRYNLLSPERTSTNIRTYSLASLQKLLNITLLYNNGYKISKIAAIPKDEIPVVVKGVISKNDNENHALNALKMAMINFDQSLFQKTYNQLLKKRPFRSIFWDVFMPFLNEIGLLWQTDTISPSHEHFITNQIKQKIYSSSEKLQAIEPVKKDKVFVLFLPDNEIHEIGLLFVNYEILLKGYKTIYLGQSMPMENLIDLKNNFKNIHFLSYFTVVPTKDRLAKYISIFNEKIANGTGAKLWILGQQIKHLNPDNLPSNIKTFESIEALSKEL